MRFISAGIIEYFENHIKTIIKNIYTINIYQYDNLIFDIEVTTNDNIYYFTSIDFHILNYTDIKYNKKILAYGFINYN